MITLVAERDHAERFNQDFIHLFGDLSDFARSRGIRRYSNYGGPAVSEDPDDFAQECLIEYARRSKRDQYRAIQTALIWHIANNRIIDAWRKNRKTPKRDDFEASTSQLTEEAGSFGDVPELVSMPELRGLSSKAIEILLLKHVAEFLDDEIANVMNMSIEGVRSSLKRSRKRMLAGRGETA